MQISPTNLHISSFVIVKKKTGPGDGDYSILFVKVGSKHPVSFRRGKLVVPSTFLSFGEMPKNAAKRALSQALHNSEQLHDTLQLLSMQSFYVAHWDIVFLWEAWIKEGFKEVTAKEPYIEVRFCSPSNLPRSEISDDHLDVLDEMLHPTSVST